MMKYKRTWLIFKKNKGATTLAVMIDGWIVRARIDHRRQCRAAESPCLDPSHPLMDRKLEVLFCICWLRKKL